MSDQRKAHRRELDRLLLRLFDEFQALRDVVEKHQQAVALHRQEAEVFSKRMDQIGALVDETQRHLGVVAAHCDMIEDELSRLQQREQDDGAA